MTNRTIALALLVLLAGCHSSSGPKTGLLVMSDNTGAIFTVRADGTGKTVLPRRGE